MGFWSDIAEIGIGITIVTTSLVCPPAGFAMAASTTLVGGTVAVVGKATDDEELEEVGMTLFKPGATSLVTAGTGLKAPRTKCSLPLTFCKK
ncbi:hypothetical protein [endosymbiont GvMRE of Glomus versiforme]|uniref:hypothetical protein n=1 Tax=endosymbiont GvMRE of Glomus versiforme TaxID=2039283 RepID=UPI000EC3B9AA|nr:hypothetical protein [endosymbiont GvMRE of Glomus versiforme]RHZ35669.1 hypothetical protein GvMRE_IIg239 [endosymbiont GvMRE of Glomus versiforme]